MLTELRPNWTCARIASLVVGSTLKSPTVLCSCPNAGRPTCRTLSSRTISISPSTLKSGRAPRGSSPIELDVNRDGALLRRGIDSNDLAIDDAVASVDLGFLANGQVACLRFSDAEFRFEPRRIGHSREIEARRDLLARR